MKAISPLSGWMLDVIAACDVVCPGVAGTYLRASNERRQVQAAYFAATGGTSITPVGTGFIAKANHRSILTRAYGYVPRGLRRALAKSGAQPFEQEYYRDLFEALAFGNTRVVAVIMQSTILDPARLEIIRALPDDLCDIRIVSRLEDVRQARDLLAVVDLFDARGGCRSRLISALLSSEAPLRDFLRRWTLRIPYPVHPIKQRQGYRPVRNGNELRKVALQYRNCSRRFSVSTIAGECAFGEFFGSDGKNVLLCFEKHENSWTLEGIYGYRNRPIADHLAEQVRDFVSQHGIPNRWESRHDLDDIGSALGRLIQPYQQW